MYSASVQRFLLQVSASHTLALVLIATGLGHTLSYSVRLAPFQFISVTMNWIVHTPQEAELKFELKRQEVYLSSIYEIKNLISHYVKSHYVLPFFKTQNINQVLPSITLENHDGPNSRIMINSVMHVKAEFLFFFFTRLCTVIQPNDCHIPPTKIY